MTVLDWNADAIMRKLHDGMVRGMDDAGQIAVRSERDLIGTPSPPRSRPGQPPHKDTGNLQAAQDHDVQRTANGAVLIVSGGRAPWAAAAYAPHVAKRRPWLRKGVDLVAARMVDAIGDGMRRAL